MEHSRFPFRFFLAACAAALLAACAQEPRNTEELIDPWLRERTPVNFRVESQIGAAVISNNWKDDAVGSISVSIITGGLNLSAVKVEALEFKYPESEFCPTASIGPGSTLDLSKGSAEFTVTAYNGETRTYTVSYSSFTDPLEGTYSFTPVAGILDPSNAPKSAFVVVGGWDGAIVASTVMDKWWHWADGRQPRDEDDNLLSFRLETADALTGATFGTLVNTPGEDGKYANYLYDGSIDMNSIYRLIPQGCSRWAKTGDGMIKIFDYADEAYARPLYSLALLEAGEYAYNPNDETKKFTIAHQAFARVMPGPFNVNVGDWDHDTRWFWDNLRYAVWLVKKDSDAPLADHTDYLH